ncbi:hypothetical protein DFH06DRAFT_1137252 [Mycena polygramma]|nr:hypothetical protein DFH06DRAFT_1137252 [Mycena polygramma]
MLSSSPVKTPASEWRTRHRLELGRGPGFTLFNRSATRISRSPFPPGPNRTQKQLLSLVFRTQISQVLKKLRFKLDFFFLPLIHAPERAVKQMQPYASRSHIKGRVVNDSKVSSVPPPPCSSRSPSKNARTRRIAFPQTTQPKNGCRQANVTHTCTVPCPAGVLRVSRTAEALRSSADSTEALYRRPANWPKSSKKSCRQASVTLTWNAPGPAPVVYSLSTTEAPLRGAGNAEAIIAEAPRSGAGIVNTMYGRPASGVKSSAKGRRQARCVLNCTWPLRPTPSTWLSFAFTSPRSISQRPANPQIKIRDFAFPGTGTTRSRLASPPSASASNSDAIFGSPHYVAALDSLAAANQPSNSPQSGLRLSTGPGDSNSMLSLDAGTLPMFSSESHNKIALNVQIQPRLGPLGHVQLSVPLISTAAYLRECRDYDPAQVHLAAKR